MHQATIQYLINERVPEAVDIHHAAGGEVQQRFSQPGGAVGIYAPACYFACLSHGMAAANRARLWHVKGPSIRTFFSNPHDLRYDVAATFEEHGVANLQVESCDFVFVVQSRSRDRNARNTHRLQVSN